MGVVQRLEAEPNSAAAVRGEAPSPSAFNWSWIPGLPLPAVCARGAWRLATTAVRATSGWRWLPASIAAGALPVLAFWPLAVPGCQTVSAILLALVCLGCVAERRFVPGVAAISLAFFFHSLAAGGISAYDPASGAAMLPDGHAYWEKQLAWIRTGTDPEYDPSNWLFAHARLLAGVVVYTYTSLGALTFVEGFYEVDVMNYYNAQLLLQSKSGATALGLGWHVWSFCRGFGYLLLTYEMLVLSLERLTRRTLTTRGERVFRWSLGLGFVVLDGVLKFFLLETVRSGLFQNLG